MVRGTLLLHVAGVVGTLVAPESAVPPAFIIG